MSKNTAKAAVSFSKLFRGPFRDTYRQGKTRIRDLLYEKMGFSLLEAEEIVDEMERTGKIVFTRL
jgi:hypothetical protein